MPLEQLVEASDVARVISGKGFYMWCLRHFKYLFFFYCYSSLIQHWLNDPQRFQVLWVGFKCSVLAQLYVYEMIFKCLIK